MYDNLAGGAAGNYGAGGGGGGYSAGHGGAGANGIIAITYTPSGGGGGGTTPSRTMRLFEGYRIKFISGRIILYGK